MMITLNPRISVSRDDILSVELDHRFYMNGSDTRLVVRMMDGRTHTIEHGFGNVDVYALKKKIEEA